MDYSTKKFNIRKFIIFIFFVVSFLIIIFFFIQNFYPEKYAKVVFLDIGQGDAIFIQTPNKKQILIDGGRDQNVLQALGKVMPFFDRSIDIVIGTHPDADHIGGLYYVLKEYKVGAIFEPGSQSESKIYQSFQNEIKEKNIPYLVGKYGVDIVLDKENSILLSILYPDQNPIYWETNESSIVSMFSYGNQKILLTGDSPIEKEKILIQKYGEDLRADILKLGHHGSNTSSGEEFLLIVNPEIAIVSAGKDNPYGHPHKEVLNLLNRLGIKYLETSKEGNIVCKIYIERFYCK